MRRLQGGKNTTEKKKHGNGFRNAELSSALSACWYWVLLLPNGAAGGCRPTAAVRTRGQNDGTLPSTEVKKKVQ